MAFQMQHTEQRTGAAFDAAYVRVSNIVIGTLGKTVTIQMAAYVDRAARDSDKTPADIWDEQGDYALIVEAITPNDMIERVYLWLALQTRYTAALVV